MQNRGLASNSLRADGPQVARRPWLRNLWVKITREWYQEEITMLTRLSQKEIGLEILVMK